MMVRIIFKCMHCFRTCISMAFKMYDVFICFENQGREGRDRDRQREREGARIELGALTDLPHGWHRPKHLCHPALRFPGLQQGSGWKWVTGTESVLVGDAGTMGRLYLLSQSASSKLLCLPTSMHLKLHFTNINLSQDSIFHEFLMTLTCLRTGGRI